jgi:hypothetical protein
MLNSQMQQPFYFYNEVAYLVFQHTEVYCVLCKYFNELRMYLVLWEKKSLLQRLTSFKDVGFSHLVL